MTFTRCLLAVATGVGLAAAARGDDPAGHWPRFRGPDGAGLVPDGQKLPTQFGPWHAIGVIRADKTPPFNVSRDVIEQAIAGQGFQLFKVKPKAVAAN